MKLAQGYELIRDGTVEISWIKANTDSTLAALTDVWSLGELQGLFGVTGRCLTALELAASWKLPAFSQVAYITLLRISYSHTSLLNSTVALAGYFYCCSTTETAMS